MSENTVGTQQQDELTDPKRRNEELEKEITMLKEVAKTKYSEKETAELESQLAESRKRSADAHRAASALRGRRAFPFGPRTA